MSLSLLLVGHGNMGSAMLTSWQKSPTHGVSEFYVSELGHSNCSADAKPDVIVFAVKPQDIENILPEYKNRFEDSPLYISVAAGKTLAFFAEHLGAGARVVRAMPNTPALIGKAITALCANKNVSEADKELATKLIEAFGKSVWVEEKDMDAVTALSGSGPAYVFLFMEALTKAGINAGLAPDIAKILAFEMAHGSIHLAAKSDETFEQLRKNVTSKGGTTEAALNVLMQNNVLEKLVDDAVQAAAKRSKELS
jgi:pyrroline-5-carboxylate reductase